MTALTNLAKAIASPRSSIQKEGRNSDSSLDSKGRSAKRNEEKRLEKQEKAARAERERELVEEKRRQEDERARAEEDEETRARYGWAMDARELRTIAEVDTMREGEEITFRARIHHQRQVSKALDFVLFRDQIHSIQGVLAHTTEHMIRWVQRLEDESLVQVSGTLQKPPEPVASATQHDLEVKIYSIHVVNPAQDLPFDNYSPPETTQQRLSNRVLDLRHPSNQALFKIRSTVTRKFREVLDRDDFIEIQTPKLQPAATESGAEVFKVNYFGRRAFLAQSPQLAKQMAISGDLKRVYEVSRSSSTCRRLSS